MYPIVFILNEETKMYNGYIPDLAICAVGKTLEDTIFEAQQLMTKFFDIALKYRTEIPEPSSLETIYKKWEGYKVMYVTANIK
jgi:predicted RNase H-like HicB family nuclease